MSLNPPARRPTGTAKTLPIDHPLGGGEDNECSETPLPPPWKRCAPALKGPTLYRVPTNQNPPTVLAAHYSTLYSCGINTTSIFLILSANVGVCMIAVKDRGERYDVTPTPAPVASRWPWPMR